jgi:hypothetical protein
MNNNRGISPGVWAVVFTGIAIIAFVAWLGLRSHHQPSPQPQVQTAIAPANPQPVETPQAAAAPAPVGIEGLPPVIPVPLKNILIDVESGAWLKDKDYVRRHTKRRILAVCAS